MLGEFAGTHLQGPILLKAGQTYFNKDQTFT